MNNHEFEMSNSDQFDQMVASLNLPIYEEKIDMTTPTLPPMPPPPTVPTLLPTLKEDSIFQKDLGKIYHEITFQEIRNAALTLGNRSSQFDLQWEYFSGQLNNGINALHSQSMDYSAFFALYNMVNHVRSELAMTRTATYYALLHLLEQRKKEELETKRKFDAAKQRANHRATRKKLDMWQEEDDEDDEPLIKKRKKNSPLMSSFETPPQVPKMILPKRPPPKKRGKMPASYFE